MANPRKFTFWHPALAAGVGALAAGLLVAAIPAARVPSPPAIPPPTDQTAVCVPGQGQSTLYAQGDAALKSTPLGAVGEESGNRIVADKLTAPLVLTSAKRFAAGVSFVDAHTACWSRCVPPRTTGVVQLASAKASDLLLVNTDETAAVVDFAFFGKGGELPALGSRGLTVPPKTARPLPVSVLVTEDQPVGVEVRVTSGRLAVLGRSWVSAAADFAPAGMPATSLLLPGIFANPTQTRVLVTNPGGTTATVNVAALTTQRIALQGGQNIEIPAKTTITLDVTTPLKGEAAALAVTSDVPVAATAVVGLDGDYAVSGAAEPFTVGRLLAPAGGVVSMSNPSDAPVTVTLSVVADGAATAAKSEVSIAAGKTWTAPALGSGVITYDVLATSPVVAAVSMAQPKAAWIAPLVSLTQASSSGEVTMAYQPGLG